MGRGRPITNRSNFLVDEAVVPLYEAARTAAHRFRGMDVGDYLSIGWLQVVRYLDKHLVEETGPTFLFYNCLQAMRREWARTWSKHQNEILLSPHQLESLQLVQEQDPLMSLMAEEYLMMLTWEERRLVYLRLWRGLTWREIGYQLGITKAGAHYRYRAIIKNLRQKVNSC